MPKSNTFHISITDKIPEMLGHYKEAELQTWF